MFLEPTTFIEFMHAHECWNVDGIPSMRQPIQARLHWSVLTIVYVTILRQYTSSNGPLSELGNISAETTTQCIVNGTKLFGMVQFYRKAEVQGSLLYCIGQWNMRLYAYAQNINFLSGYIASRLRKLFERSIGRRDRLVSGGNRCDR